MAYPAPDTWTAFDVESAGDEREYALQPWSAQGRLTSMATALTEQGKIRTDSTEPNASQEALKAYAKGVLLESPVVVGWNVAFDAAWLISLGLRHEVMAARWLDGMLLWKALHRLPESDIDRHKRKRYGLKYAVREFLPKYAGYEDDVVYDPQTAGEWEDLLRYNRRDAAFTLKLAKYFFSQLRKNPKQLRAALIEARAIPHVADHYVRGLLVDIEWSHDLRVKITDEIDELTERLAGHGCTPEVLASPKKLCTLFYDEWGLPILRRTPKGAPSTNVFALHDLALHDARVADIRRCRELGNLRTKFVDKVVESVMYNGGLTTHPTANLGGTYTGRLTFSSFIGKNKEKRQTGFAIHQMSGQRDFRRQISVPYGFTLIEWDAAGQEYRWMAIESEDDTMLSLCEHGEDPHAYMGANIEREWEYHNLSYEAKHGNANAARVRKMGKVANLSCQYRIGKDKFRDSARVKYGIDMSAGRASNIHDTYHTTYPGVKRYWNRAIREAKDNGYVETIAGRRILLHVDWGDQTRVWMYESASINFRIQGVGADQKFLAIATLQPLWRKYGAYFYFELHDGLYAICPTKHAKRVAVLGRKMLNSINYARAWHGFKPPIPLPWDAKLGPNWGDMEELD